MRAARGPGAALAACIGCAVVACALVGVAGFSGGEHKEAGSRGWTAAMAAVVLDLPEVTEGPGASPTADELTRMVKEVEDGPTLPFTAHLQQHMARHGCYGGFSLSTVVPAALREPLCALMVGLGIDPNNVEWRRDKTLRVFARERLTYGYVVAMAGDFYGVPEEPISQPTDKAARQRAFVHAFNTLASPPEGERARRKFVETLQNVRDMIAEEKEKVAPRPRATARGCARSRARAGGERVHQRHARLGRVRAARARALGGPVSVRGEAVR